MKAAGNAGRSRAAVGFDHIAIDENRPLAED